MPFFLRGVTQSPTRSVGDNKPPAMRVRDECYTKTPFRYNDGVQAELLHGKVFFRQLCAYKGMKILKGHLMPDNIHKLVGTPTKINVSQLIKFFRDKNTLMIFEKHTKLKYKLCTDGPGQTSSKQAR